MGGPQPSLVERTPPDVLVTTTMGNALADTYVMRWARRHAIPVVTVVLSWDNTSKWGIGGVRPDRVLVWSDVQREEVIRGHDGAPERIRVVGAPQFDHYARALDVSEEAFRDTHDLARDRRVIVLGTKAPQNFATNAHVARVICEAIMGGRLAVPSQLLVRLHPQYFRAGEGALSNQVLQRMLNEFAEIRTWCPYVRVNRPVILSAHLDMDMPASEMRDLHAILTYADVLVNPFSTLNVEACLHDLPTVNVAFDGPPDAGFTHLSRRSISVDERHAHNARVLRWPFTVVARDPDELVRGINGYLADRSIHAQGRRQVAAQECGVIDGAAGRRVVREILDSAGAGH